VRTNISKKFIRDVVSDPVILLTHRHYFKIIFTFVALLAVIDPLLVIFAYAIPATGCLNGVSAVTVISHIHGYRSYDVNDTSRNSWIASVLSLGEGWHNNHHAKPYQWCQGEQWWEIDPPSWIIRLIQQK
jgi:stearoyl-CoA desaturase (delta-9 desaturase)